MKKFLLLFLLLAEKGFSQKYQPFDTNMVWYSYTVPYGKCYTTYRNYVKGFIVNNHRTWHKVCVTATVNPCNPSTPQKVTDSLTGLFSNDTLGKKVYFVSTSTPTLPTDFVPGSKHVLFNFNLTLGSNISLPSAFLINGRYKVIAIDSVFFGNKYHKLYRSIRTWDSVHDLYPTPGNVTLIEGVGASIGVFNQKYESLVYAEQWLKCFSVSGHTKYFPLVKPVYTPGGYDHGYSYAIRDTISCNLAVTSITEVIRDNEQVQFFPNPISDRLTINYEANGLKEDNLEILDVSGRLVLKTQIHESLTSINLSELRSGIYLLRLSKQGRLPLTQKIIKE